MVPETPAPVPEPVQPAPKLKLKLGATQPTVDGETPKAPPKPKRPPKPRQMKATDMPPPPYVDDGSHDILQEVIALEELEKSPNKSSSSKPRKVVELDADEELLRLASPEEKSVHEHSATSDKHHSPPPPAAPPLLASPKPTPTQTPIKMKKPDVRQSHSSPSTKGKEKEAELIPPRASSSRASSVAPSKPKKASTPVPFATTASMPINEAKCREVLKTLVNLPESFIFREPVDPIRDGCPT